MSGFIEATGALGGPADAIAIVERDRDRDRRRDCYIERPLPQVSLRLPLAGSAGVVTVVGEYGLYVPHVGTSPTVLDYRGTTRGAQLPAPASIAPAPRTTTRKAILRRSASEQALEAMAALNLNKSQFAEVIGVTRPTLYDWLEGKEPNVANGRRLTALLQLLADAGVTAADSLSPRFVREALTDGEPSLLDLLKADNVDETRVARVLADAKALEEEAQRTRRAREDRLRALGFEEPTAEQRETNLALNTALAEWSKD